jgi:hypothetical protein
MASSSTGVDHPLCLDCAVLLRDEVGAQVKDAQREITAYSRALAELERDAASPLSEVRQHGQWLRSGAFSLFASYFLPRGVRRQSPVA